MRKFKVLVACEESQAVLKEILNLNNDNILVRSCDILECSGGLPEYHIQYNCIDIMNTFEWDMIIAFPPCTHLAVSGARHFEKKREDGRQKEAIKFFSYLYEYPCKYKMIENPVNIIGSEYQLKWFPDTTKMRTADQYIQPYEFGDPYRKKTGLWLFNLPKLEYTNIVEPKLVKYGNKTYSADCGICKDGKERSKTYPGIAKAIAQQLVTYAYNDFCKEDNV